MPKPDTSHLPWWSSQVPASAVTGEITRQEKRNVNQVKARSLKRAARAELNRRVSLKRNGLPLYQRFLNALAAGKFTIGQEITRHDLVAAGVVPDYIGNSHLDIIQADLAAHPQESKGIRLKFRGFITPAAGATAGPGGARRTFQIIQQQP